MHSGYLRRSEELAGTCRTVLPWNRSMWRIGCGTYIVLPENGRMRSHLVAVRTYSPNITDISRFVRVACSCLYTEMHVGSNLLFRKKKKKKRKKKKKKRLWT